MKVTEDICPLTEHRARLTEHLRQVQETGRPLVVTQNGKAAGILLSPAYYNELMEMVEQAEITAALKRADAHREAGCIHDASASVDAIARKFGLKIG